VVEDNPVILEMMGRVLATAGYEVLEAPDGRTALDLMRRADPLPSLILQDIILPDIDGFDLVRQLRAGPHGTEIPILACTGYLSSAEEAQVASVGFDGLMLKPIERSLLLATIAPFLARHSMLPAVTASGTRVLIVDDDPIQLMLARASLAHQGFEVLTAGTGAQALEQARRVPPDVILSDVLMPEIDGFRLAQAVRQDGQIAHIPVILATSSIVEDADRQLAFMSGAQELVHKSPGFEHAIDAVRRWEATPVVRDDTPLDAAEAERQYTDRVRAQLERQVSLNTGLVQRVSILKASLAALGSIGAVLGRRGESTGTLQEVLVQCLDIAGISRGALFLERPRGMCSAVTSVGFEDEDQDALASCFGEPDLFAVVAQSETVLSLTAGRTVGEAQQRLLAALGKSAALLVPINASPIHGVLLLASANRDLSTDAWRAFATTLAAQLGQALALENAFTELVTSEQRFRAVVDSSPTGMVVVNAHGRIHLVNERLAAMFGYAPETLPGLPLGLLLPEADRVAHERACEGYNEAPAARAMGAGREVSGRRQDGSVIPIEVGLVPLTMDGERMTLASVIDITKRKASERALADREARLRALMENAGDGITVISQDGLILEVNRRATEILGLSSGEIVGRHIESFIPVDPTGRHVRNFRDAVVRGRGAAPGVPILRPDGSTAVVDFALSLVDLGEERVVLSIGREVTEREALEAQFRQAQKMEAVGLLAGGVAHDFNNLLTAIGGHAQLVLEDLPADDPRRNDLETILAASARAGELTNQLLAFSRKQVLSPAVQDPAVLVRELEKMVGRLMFEEIRLVIRIDETAGRILADAGQLTQVLMNLVVNARDAMPQGGVLTISVAPGRLQGQEAVELAVSDTGTGMSESVRGRVFEPFFTTKAIGKGTGLGLSTAYGIVQQSGGVIEVDSELGRGSTFRILLPTVPARDEAPGIAERSPATGGTETILLVEDDAGVRSFAARALRRAGYVILEASEATKAIAMAAAHRGVVHLLVTDVVLPGMNGRALADRLQASRASLKILYTSGYTDDEVVRRGVLQQCVAFLQKPYSVAQLTQQVRRILDS
jgi:PAS domain S-box-containing protein